jgi:hypothetical protein
MSDVLADLFSNDAFSVTSMIAAINDVDHIPSRAGERVFANSDVMQGIPTINAAVERVGEELKLVQTTARGAPAEKLVGDRRSLLELKIPHIPLEDTIHADEVQGVREFGTTDQLRTVQSVVNKRLTKIARRLDLTLEHHRLGALKGVIRDADGSILTNLYEAFGFLNSSGIAGPEVFDFDLDSLATESEDIRVKAQAVTRYMHRQAKAVLPKDAYVWAFAGDNFFDKLISRPDVKSAWIGSNNAAAVLGENYAFGVFEFGGIFWENYQGTDDNETVAIDPDEVRFFWSGAPEIYGEYYAPADYIETVNTEGLPRYAKLAPDPKFGRYVDIEAQMNPLPVCLRPSTLCKGVASLP